MGFMVASQSEIENCEKVTISPTFSSSNTASYTLDRDCKVLYIVFIRHGYGGSSISISGPNVSSLSYTTNFVNASFGNWGAMFLVAYGLNMKKGNVLNMSGSGNINAGGSLILGYVN